MTVAVEDRHGQAAVDGIPQSVTRTPPYGAVEFPAGQEVATRDRGCLPQFSGSLSFIATHTEARHRVARALAVASAAVVAAESLPMRRPAQLLGLFRHVQLAARAAVIAGVIRLAAASDAMMCGSQLSPGGTATARARGMWGAHAERSMALVTSSRRLIGQLGVDCLAGRKRRTPLARASPRSALAP